MEEQDNVSQWVLSVAKSRRVSKVGKQNKNHYAHAVFKNKIQESMITQWESARGKSCEHHTVVEAEKNSPNGCKVCKGVRVLCYIQLGLGQEQFNNGPGLHSGSRIMEEMMLNKMCL